MITRLLFFIGRGICHQLPSRSFIIAGQQLPLCARCTGIYIGVFVCLLYLWLRRRWRGNLVPSLGLVIFMAAGFIPLMLDGATSYLGLRDSSNLLRVVTGILMGYSLPVWIVLLKNFSIKDANTDPIIFSYKELCIILLLAGGMGFFVYNDVLMNWWFVAGTCIISIVFLYIHIAAIIIKQIFTRLRPHHVFAIAVFIAIGLLTVLSIINRTLQTLFL